MSEFQKLSLTGVKELSSRESRYQLQRIYKKILRLLEKMPEKAAYRINTEQIVCYRLSVVEVCTSTEVGSSGLNL